MPISFAASAETTKRAPHTRALQLAETEQRLLETRSADLSLPPAAGLTQYLLRARTPDRVVIMPLTSNPYGWHVAADLLVCASDNESLPRVILEAMPFGTLVVSTDVFGSPESVEDATSPGTCAAAAPRRRLQRS